MQYLTKEQIIAAAEKSMELFSAACASAAENIFFSRPETGKWSVAEHLQHLIISTNTTTLAYTLPAFIVKWVGGKPNRDSRSYEAVVEKYKEELAAGGRATGRFVPKPMTLSDSKQQLLGKWTTASAKFISALKKTKSESKFENYLARHPLLGRITLRELCYFTIYHTEHHTNIVKQIINPKK